MGKKLWFKLVNGIGQDDYERIRSLEHLCTNTDNAMLKLELLYKMAKMESGDIPTWEINEFMCFDGDLLVGYIGLGCFDPRIAEVNGMVHPSYRQLGIFHRLFSFVKEEWLKRSADKMLLLSDRNSISGNGFIKSTGASYDHSEYEMYMRKESERKPTQPCLTLRKATNADGEEIARQDAIFFHRDGDTVVEQYIIPEDEEKYGIEIYLAQLDGLPMGKIHLEVANGIGGIYGLGILPHYRGKGYGRELLNQGVAILQQKGCNVVKLQVEVANEKALQLYKSCGFEVVSVMDYYALKKE